MLILNYKRYEVIKETTAHALQLGGIYELPICPHALAASLGIKLIPYSSLSPAKQKVCIEASSDGFVLIDTIYYNESRYEKRIRFTIMHEIGHIMLNHNTSTSEIEREANFFARFILAPPVLIYAHDRTCDIDKKTISEIFNISDEAAGYAYDYYLKWLAKINKTFCLSPVDSTIFNLFFTS